MPIRILYCGLSLLWIYAIILALGTGYADFWSIRERLIYIFIFLGCLGTLVLCRRIITKLIHRANRILDQQGILPIIITALCLRISWVLFSDTQITSDFTLYHQLALELLEAPYLLHELKPLGTSFFLALHYKLFGINTLYPLLTLAILSSLQILILHDWIRRRTGLKNVALWASLFLALNPEHILLTNLIGSDVLYSFVLWLGIWVFTVGIRKNEHVESYLFVSGLILGLSHWIRPTTPLFVLALSIFFLFTNNSFKQKLGNIFYLGMGFLILISPIIIQNEVQTNTLSISPTHRSGVSLMIGTYEPGHGRHHAWRQSPHYDLWQERTQLHASNNQTSWGIAQNSAGREIAIETLKENPVRFLSLVAKHKISNFWGLVAGLGFSLNTSRLKDIQYPLWGLADLWHKLSLLLAAMALWSLARREASQVDEIFILIISAWLFSLSHMFLEAHPRYHHMFLPLIAYFIGVWVHSHCLAKTPKFKEFPGG